MSGWRSGRLATGAVGSIVFAPGFSLLRKRLMLAVLGWYYVVDGMAILRFLGSFPGISRVD